MTFRVPSVIVPAGGSASFNVTIDAHPGLPDRSLYGGYITLTPRGGGPVYRVPFAGFKGDYQSTVVLTPTANGFPWLAQIVGASYVNRPAGGTYTMVGGDIPQFLLHLDHPSRRIRLEAFDALSGQAWNIVSDDEYVSRKNSRRRLLRLSLGRQHRPGHGQAPVVHRAQRQVRREGLRPEGARRREQSGALGKVDVAADHDRPSVSNV